MSKVFCAILLTNYCRDKKCDRFNCCRDENAIARLYINGLDQASKIGHDLAYQK